MSRLTITITDGLHRALREAAGRQGRSISALIEESLRLGLVRGNENAQALVAKARQRAQLDADQAKNLAVKQTRTTRER